MRARIARAAMVIGVGVVIVLAGILTSSNAHGAGPVTFAFRDTTAGGFYGDPGSTQLFDEHPMEGLAGKFCAFTFTVSNNESPPDGDTPRRTDIALLGAGFNLVARDVERAPGVSTTVFGRFVAPEILKAYVTFGAVGAESTRKVVTVDCDEAPTTTVPVTTTTVAPTPVVVPVAPPRFAG